MKKDELILSCMAPAGTMPHQPVQIQKLIFIFQEKAGDSIGGTPFKFSPYDYGPFDPSVYQCLDELAAQGLVTLVGQPFSRHRAYCLSEEGVKVASKILSSMPANSRQFLDRLSQWVRSLTFSQLVGAVYNAYPAMRRNSIFRDDQ